MKSSAVIHLYVYNFLMNDFLVESRGINCYENNIKFRLWLEKPEFKKALDARNASGSAFRSFLLEMQNCNVYHGNIVIDENSAEMTDFGENVRHEDLEILTSLRVINGFVYLSLKKYPDIRNLWFFRGLREINTQDPRGFTVTSTHLTMLDLSKLRLNVPYFGIKHNKNLCYLENIKTINSSIRFELYDNMNASTCAYYERVCAKTCNPNKGCWGPYERHCFECQQWRVDDTCTERCEYSQHFYTPYEEGAGKECGHCHEKCIYGCFGPSVKQCFAPPDPNDRCPYYMYFDLDASECKECSKNCFGESYNDRERLIFRACLGPKSKAGFKGCTVRCSGDTFLSIRKDGLISCEECHKECRCGCRNTTLAGCLPEGHPKAKCRLVKIIPEKRKFIDEVWIVIAAAIVTFFVTFACGTLISRKLQKKLKYKCKPKIINAIISVQYEPVKRKEPSKLTDL